MTITPVHAIAALSALRTAAQIPAVLKSADFAGVLNGILGKPAGGAASPDAPQLPQKHSPTSDVAALLDIFQSQFRQVLESAGIAARAPVSLGLDPGGQLAADSEHPQQAEINAALSRHPGLTDFFRAIAAGINADDPESIRLTFDFRGPAQSAVAPHKGV